MIEFRQKEFGHVKLHTPKAILFRKKQVSNKIKPGGVKGKVELMRDAISDVNKAKYYYDTTSAGNIVADGVKKIGKNPTGTAAAIGTALITKGPGVGTAFAVGQSVGSKLPIVKHLPKVTEPAANVVASGLQKSIDGTVNATKKIIYRKAQ